MVTTDPTYCPDCGGELGRRTIEGRERAWCPGCERVLFRNAVVSTSIVVHDDDQVVLIERAAPPVGLWAIPGGHPEYDEHPRAAAARELEEETGIRAETTALDLLTVVDGPTTTEPTRYYYFIVYVVEHSETNGALRAASDATEVTFWPLDDLPSAPTELRDIDAETIDRFLEMRD